MAGPPLRTVLSPAAPERGTGGMSPEVGPTDSLAEDRGGLEAESGTGAAALMVGSAALHWWVCLMDPHYQVHPQGWHSRKCCLMSDTTSVYLELL